MAVCGGCPESSGFREHRLLTLFNQIKKYAKNAMKIHPRFPSLLTSLLLLGLPLSTMAGFDEAEAANRRGERDSAYREYSSAALAGDIRAFGKLGSLYLYGQGTSRDYVQAYVWFGLAHEAGDRYALRFQQAAASAMTQQQMDLSEAQLKERRTQLESKKTDTGK